MRRVRDSNPGRTCILNGFQDRRIQPLCQLSDFLSSETYSLIYNSLFLFLFYMLQILKQASQCKRFSKVYVLSWIWLIQNYVQSVFFVNHLYVQHSICSLFYYIKYIQNTFQDRRISRRAGQATFTPLCGDSANSPFSFNLGCKYRNCCPSHKDFFLNFLSKHYKNRAQNE